MVIDPAIADALEPLALRLIDWNAQVNLVSRREIDAIRDRHLYPIALAIRKIPLRPGLSLADVGTGGGLPGLVIARLHRNVSCTLIDSVGRKTRVVQAIASELGLSNVTVRQCRAEDLRETFDLVTGRAVADFARFLGWTRHLVKRRPGPGGGIWYFKGGDVAAELEALGIRGATIHPMDTLTGDSSLADKVLVHLPAAAVLQYRPS